MGVHAGRDDALEVDPAAADVERDVGNWRDGGDDLQLRLRCGRSRRGEHRCEKSENERSDQRTTMHRDPPWWIGAAASRGATHIPTVTRNDLLSPIEATATT